MTTSLSNIHNPTEELKQYIDFQKEIYRIEYGFDEGLVSIPSNIDASDFYNSFKDSINSEDFTVEKAIFVASL